MDKSLSMIERMIIIGNLFFSNPSSFIENEFRKFFFEYISSTSFLPYIDNEKQFFMIHQKLIGQPTYRQSQVAMSAATANIDNDQTDDTEEMKTTEATNKTIDKVKNYGNKLFIHYTHEKRFQSFKRDMHQVYQDVFKDTPAMDVKMIVDNRNRRDTRNDLILKQPKQALLQNKAIKSEHLKTIKYDII